MESCELLIICVSAFVAVFILLTLLAVIMRLIIVAFPEKVMAQDTDAAMIAAVSAALTAIYPGTRVTKIEEIK